MRTDSLEAYRDIETLKPLRFSLFEKPSKYQTMSIVACLWILVTSLVSLVFIYSGSSLLVGVLVVAGVITSTVVYWRVDLQSEAKKEISEFSQGSVCVWQMDREA
ncbi:MAG: hypothetical protein MI867_09150 [Pseudomonadales bacterium]|nr:hypothetical protein [Pseudomonadales bacterium]